MKFAEKTIKLEKLIETKVDLEILIRMNIQKKNNLIFSKDFDAQKIKDIDETIATIDEQLIEVKLAIQQANTNEIHADGNTNNYYIYKLSALNRKLASLRELEQKGETNITLFDKVSTKGKFGNHNSKLRERLTTKKEIEKRLKEIAASIADLEKSITEIKAKLSDFNNRIEVKVKVFEGFEELKNLK